MQMEVGYKAPLVLKFVVGQVWFSIFRHHRPVLAVYPYCSDEGGKPRDRQHWPDQAVAIKWA